MVGPCSTDPSVELCSSQSRDIHDGRMGAFQTNSAPVFALAGDFDDADEFESMHGLFAVEDGWEQGGFDDSDLWALGILIEAGGTEDPAVTGVSWARIKASLSK